MTLKIQIYTDGSYYDEYLLGGYAALLLAKEDGRVVKEKLVAVAGKQTNSMRAELAAVILGLRQVKGEGVRITVFSDCKTMIDCLQRKTIPDTHRDLWDKLLALADKHDVRWHWVRGHDGQPENMRVNDAARNAVKKLKRIPRQL